MYFLLRSRDISLIVPAGDSAVGGEGELEVGAEIKKKKIIRDDLKC